MTFHGPDRILWNRRPSGALDAGDIDEIVLSGVDVHIEQMDDRCWWIGIYADASQGDTAYWMGNFVADSRGRMRFVEQENNGIEWGVDKEHPEPGACGDPACPVLHADPANPIHPPGYVDSREDRP